MKIREQTQKHNIFKLFDNLAYIHRIMEPRGFMFFAHSSEIIGSNDIRLLVSHYER